MNRTWAVIALVSTGLLVGMLIGNRARPGIVSSARAAEPAALPAAASTAQQLTASIDYFEYGPWRGQHEHQMRAIRRTHQSGVGAMFVRFFDTTITEADARTLLKSLDAAKAFRYADTPAAGATEHEGVINTSPYEFAALKNMTVDGKGIIPSFLGPYSVAQLADDLRQALVDLDAIKATKPACTF